MRDKPLVCATLTTISKYFKSTQTNPGKPGSYEIGKHTVKLPVAA